ncbi:MAG: aldehyde dehydrogenase family protein [Hyphomonadaceae bacterium]|nr:aldehyde dehydrogenase family protein [Hyphomonadaceae bacterium]
MKELISGIPEVQAGLFCAAPMDCGVARRLPVINPHTEQPVLELAETSADQVGRCVEKAKETFARGDWSRAPLLQRQAVLNRTADLIRDNLDEMAALDSVTTGLPYYRAMRGQAAAAAGWFDYFAAALGNMDERLFRQIPQANTLITREPVGVAGLFTPWNIPLMGAALKLAAALAMGNSCIIKPSEQSPLAGARLVELLFEAGLPTGVLHLVNGRGHVTGAALAAHPDVALISFTGGAGAGRFIARAAMDRFAKVTMELGGKSANIIFDDADYEKALKGSLTAVYANNGQACLAGSRIFVHRKIADNFVADFVKRAQGIRIGDPFEAATELGPQASRAQMERVLSFVDVVREEGGEILSGGGRASGFENGFYIDPVVARVESNTSRVCQEEIFGPFAAFMVFDDEDAVIAQANDTAFGLAGYVWSENLGRALRVSGQLRSGYVLVNTAMVRERNAPFGGYAQSGLDREGGRWSLDFYSEAKTTVIPYDDPYIPAPGKTI